MVVFVIYSIRIFSDKGERDPPIPADRDSPFTFSIALERMQIEPRKRHILWTCCGAQPSQNQTKPLSMLRLDSRL